MLKILLSFVIDKFVDNLFCYIILIAVCSYNQYPYQDQYTKCCSLLRIKISLLKRKILSFSLSNYKSLLMIDKFACKLFLCHMRIFLLNFSFLKQKLQINNHNVKLLNTSFVLKQKSLWIANCLYGSFLLSYKLLLYWY
jgi:hypothetical protein